MSQEQNNLDIGQIGDILSQSSGSSDEEVLRLHLKNNSVFSLILFSSEFTR